jgi:hypothetical protein
MSEQRQDNPNRTETEYSNPGDWRSQRREWRRNMRQRNPLKGLIPGLILVLLGSLLFLANRGTLDWGSWWQYFLVGLGIIFILDGIIHYFSSERGWANWGKFIPGVVLLLVGLAFIFSFTEWWPMILVGIGIMLLLGLFFRRN